MSARIARLTALFAAIVMSLLGTILRAAVPAAALTEDYVALGDSYASGEGNPEGNPPYFDSVNCHRSHAAYPWRLTIRSPDPSGLLELSLTEDTHVACTGAVTRDIYTDKVVRSGRRGSIRKVIPAQAKAINSSTDLVSVTIGGNDVGFSDFIKICVAERMSCEDKLLARGPELIAANLEPGLSRAFDAIEERLATVGSNADVVVVGYPRLFPKNPTDEQIRSCTPVQNPYREDQYGVAARLGLNGPGISADEMMAFNSVQREVNAAINEAAEQHGFLYVDVEDAFAGHELCTANPYLRGFVPSTDITRGFTDPASFHPNSQGHQKIADIIRNMIFLPSPSLPAAPTELTFAGHSCPATFHLEFKDNALNETGFRVRDSITGFTQDYQNRPETGPARVDVTGLGILAGSQHRFTVSAFNDNGESAPSNAVPASADCRGRAT